MEGRYYRKQRKRVGLKKRLTSRGMIIGSVIGLPLILYVLFGSHGILQRMSLEAEKKELEERVLIAEEENRVLEAESKALESDMNTIEKVARERYGMSREEEKVYRIRKKEE